MSLAARKLLVGLIGANIQFSKSPALHEEEGRNVNLDITYNLLDITQTTSLPNTLSGLVDYAEKSGYAGINITHPCKQDVIPLLTSLSDDARMLGAVNTVVFKNGDRIGYNTDWYGFYKNFERGLPDAKKNCALLLGAGGAGVAVAHAAIKLSIQKLYIYDQDHKRAKLLSEQLSERFNKNVAVFTDNLKEAMHSADGLIHATPCGMKNYPGLPIDPDFIEKRHWIADIVYVPLMTELLQTAKDKGCEILRGGGMTVFQAAKAFEYFTGIAPDSERMLAHFHKITQS